MSRRADAGFATVFTVVTMLALLVTVAVALQLGAAALARHRAEVAADLGALAGALTILDGPARACVRAGEVVASNGADITSCRAEGADLLVTVSVPVRLGPLVAAATARARAGPTSHQAR